MISKNVRRHPLRGVLAVIGVLCMGLFVAACETGTSSAGGEEQAGTTSAEGTEEEAGVQEGGQRAQAEGMQAGSDQQEGTWPYAPTIADDKDAPAVVVPRDAEEVAEAYLEAVKNDDREMAKRLISEASLATRGGIIANTDLWKGLMDTSLPLKVQEVRTSGESGQVVYAAGSEEYRFNLKQDDGAWRIHFGDKVIGATSEKTKGAASGAPGRRTREEGPPQIPSY